MIRDYRKLSHHKDSVPLLSARADTRSAAEKDSKLFNMAETIVGWVGDGILRADFDFAIHDQQHDFATRQMIIFKSELNKAIPYGKN